MGAKGKRAWRRRKGAAPHSGLVIAADAKGGWIKLSCLLPF